LAGARLLAAQRLRFEVQDDLSEVSSVAAVHYLADRWRCARVRCLSISVRKRP
jgi:hypothetical protein